MKINFWTEKRRDFCNQISDIRFATKYLGANWERKKNDLLDCRLAIFRRGNDKLRLSVIPLIV